MTCRNLIASLISKVGGRYSCELGIDLDSKRSEEIFRWFLASVLFGARIGEKIAINTYNEFKKSGVLSPRKIIDTGWDGLVEILDSGGYVRYDFKTATKLLNVCDTLMKDYNGDHNLLHRVAKDVWEKANPPLQELVILSARKLGFITEEGNALQRLRLIWKENGIKGKGIADFEVSLLRLSKNFCRKRKCGLCPVSSWCPEKEDSLY
jgi:hypothetical protein